MSGDLLPFPRPSGRQAPTFLELAQEWLATEALRLVAPQNERRHIEHLRVLWALTEEGLRPRVVKAALAALLAPQGPLCAATVNKVRGTGRRVISEALLNERWSKPNPFDVVRRFREDRKAHRTLSLAEVRRLLPELRADRRREVLCMLYLGTRPGELKALQRVDIDLARGEVLIRRSNGRDRTKTGKPRRLPIPSGLGPALKEALAVAPAGCPLIFPSKNGGRQRPDAKLTRMLGAALRRAGLVTGYAYTCRRCGHRDGRAQLEDLRCPGCGMRLWATGSPVPVRYYDLRHSAATLHREAGCDPLVIQLALGHAPETLTDSVYTHLSDEYVRRELDRLRI
ncbi:MAG: tyrosine-type recombinase/integrase [Candidatus Acidiferrales bacterium]